MARQFTVARVVVKYWEVVGGRESDTRDKDTLAPYPAQDFRFQRHPRAQTSS